MADSTSLLIPVQELSQVGDARRKAVHLVEPHQFDEVDRGNVALVVSELATNLVKHAREGCLLLRMLAPPDGGHQLEVISIDQGPGLRHVDDCLQDGYSTTGSPGLGLGAIRRLSSSWDIYSQPDKGTVQVARLTPRSSKAPPTTNLPISGVCIPMAGETACGDAWHSVADGSIRRILVADGLGHGAPAALASGEAVQILQANPYASPLELLQVAHPALRATRGAAVAVAELRPEENTLHFAGVGNIGALIATGDGSGTRSMVSINGTLGCQSPRFKDFAYPLPAGSKVILFSDGLVTQVRLDTYHGLLDHDLAVIAGVLYRDFQRGRDDATVVVAGVA